MAFSNAWFEKFGELSAIDLRPLFTVIVYPANTSNDAWAIAPKSALSPRLPTPMPLTKTVRELPVRFALCGIHFGGGGYAGLGLTCGATLLPLTNIALPFANTVNWDASTGAVLLHPWPVLHLSLCLDILGMTVFMDAKNRLVYNLNLLN